MKGNSKVPVNELCFLSLYNVSTTTKLTTNVSHIMHNDMVEWHHFQASTNKQSKILPNPDMGCIKHHHNTTYWLAVLGICLYSCGCPKFCNHIATFFTPVWMCLWVTPTHLWGKPNQEARHLFCLTTEVLPTAINTPLCTIRQNLYLYFDQSVTKHAHKAEIISLHVCNKSAAVLFSTLDHVFTL